MRPQIHLYIQSEDVTVSCIPKHTCNQNRCREHLQIRRAPVRPIQHRGDGAHSTLRSMLPQSPREAIPSSNNKHHVLLLPAFRSVHIIRDTGNRERMCLGGQRANGGQDDVCMLSRLPRDITAHRETNGVLGKELDGSFTRGLGEAVPDPTIPNDAHQARRAVNCPENEGGPNIVIEAIGVPINFRPQLGD